MLEKKRKQVTTNIDKTASYPYNKGEHTFTHTNICVCISAIANKRSPASTGLQCKPYKTVVELNDKNNR